jgi:flavin reductase (DIM6/NTAB) family NADH-FMN oxidoreductase RutF
MELRYDMLNMGVNVVCAARDDRRSGLAVAWAMQVSVNKVLICVGKQSATRELILESEAFGLSVLAKDQIELARLFGTKSSREVDKFAGLGFHTGETGSPLLDDCALCLDCRVAEVFDMDTQKLILGEVVGGERIREDCEPLIYCQEDY